LTAAETRFRAAFFDVDGTLVDSNRRFHPLTVAAIHRMREQGFGRSLATGRMWRSARPFAEAIAADLPLVLYNGARVTDPTSGRTLEEVLLPLAQATFGVEAARRHGLHINYYLGDDLFVERLDERALGSMVKDGSDPQRVESLDRLLDRDPVKLLCIGTPEQCDAFKAEVDRGAPGPKRPTVVRSEPEYVEVLAPGVTKGGGLAVALRHAGLAPSEVVAFGDNLNDLELLELAGLGVAPGDGHPGAVQRADRVIGDHDSDAVGRALFDIFALEREAG